MNTIIYVKKDTKVHGIQKGKCLKCHKSFEVGCRAYFCSDFCRDQAGNIVYMPYKALNAHSDVYL